MSDTPIDLDESKKKCQAFLEDVFGMVQELREHRERTMNALAWLGRWRAVLPQEAVERLQDVLGVPALVKNLTRNI